MKEQDLAGKWQLAPIPHSGIAAEKVETWHEMDVPSHWQQHEQLRDYAGFMLYRHNFSAKVKKGKRYHLVLPGVFYWSTVFFNGRRLGDHEGYFTPQRYDVTGLIKAKNELLVEVHCPNEKVKNDKRMITGVFSHWDCLDPTTNPGGIWLAPEIHETGEAVIEHCLLHTDEIDEAGDADVTLRLEIVAEQAGAYKCDVTFKPANFKGKEFTFSREIELDEGRNKLVYNFHLEQPELWWTHDRGKPNLYAFDVALKKGRTVSDRAEHEIGIRTARFDDWQFTLNNQKLYLKGNNNPPTDTRIATVDYDACVRDMKLYKECHMNIIRVHAHVDHPEFYRAADREGVLIWQDFPLQWSYSRVILPIAERMIQGMVKLLYNHPAVVTWTCHNEPIYLIDTAGTSKLELAKTMFSLFAWSWDRNVLDPALKKAVEAVDPSRFCNKCSGEVEMPWQRGGDTHFYFGWYREQGPTYWLFDWIIYRRRSKNLRFVTEFGAQSLPNLENSKKFMDADIKKIDWAKLERKHSLQKDLLDYWVGLEQPDLATLVEKSQAYQSELNRFHLDRIRSVKYEIGGGVLPFMFLDPNPAIQWSIVDYWREPKASYYAMRDALRPVYPFVIFDRDKRKNYGRPVRMDVYLVNDTLDDLGEVPLTLTITGPDGKQVAEHRAAREIGPDGPAVHFITVFESPETPGLYTVTLSMKRKGDAFDNVYTFTVE